MKNWPKKKVTLFAVIIFCAGIIANYYASVYAINIASNSVTDLILSNIPTFNVHTFFVYGPILIAIFTIIVLIRRPHEIPFTLQALGLLFLARAMFVTLTHVGVDPNHIIVDFNFFNIFSSGGDLFFSGHTAVPYMLALVFWKHYHLRIFFIALSFFFGAIVLMGHLHYSIDVVGAFFITYTVYHIARVLFGRSKFS